MSMLNFYAGNDDKGPALKKAIEHAAAKSKLSISEWMRRAVMEKLRRDGFDYED